MTDPSRSSTVDMDLNALLPHRPPMQLLTRMLAVAKDEVWSAVALDQHSPFVEHTTRSVSTIVLLEYLAQTAAAFFALQALDDQAVSGGEAVAPRPGMLIGCSRLDCADSAISIPTTLVVQAQLASPLPDSSTASALVRFSGTVFNLPQQTQVFADGAALIEAAQPTAAVAQAAFSVYLPAAAATE